MKYICVKPIVSDVINVPVGAVMNCEGVGPSPEHWQLAPESQQPNTVSGHSRMSRKEENLIKIKEVLKYVKENTLFWDQSNANLEAFYRANQGNSTGTACMVQLRVRFALDLEV